MKWLGGLAGVLVVGSVALLCGLYLWEPANSFLGETSRAEFAAQITGTYIVVVSALFSFAKYLDQRNKEFLLELWTIQIPVYQEAVRITSELATAAPFTANDTVQLRKRFWELYWGQLAILEDSVVEEAMVRFGDLLGQLVKDVSNGDARDISFGDRESLENASLYVAQACRQSLSKTFGLGLPGVAKRVGRSSKPPGPGFAFKENPKARL